MKPAYDALGAWVEERGFDPVGDRWDTYFSDPDESPDAKTWAPRSFSPTAGLTRPGDVAPSQDHRSSSTPVPTRLRPNDLERCDSGSAVSMRGPEIVAYGDNLSADPWDRHRHGT